MTGPADVQPHTEPAGQVRVDDWFAKARAAVLTAHRKECDADKHDERCEWDIEFRMCHCHRRKRLAAGTTSPPTLVFMPPNCSECWDSCTHDGDGWYCPDCQVYFGDRYDEPGEWQDEHAKDDAELLTLRAAALNRKASA